MRELIFVGAHVEFGSRAVQTDSRDINRARIPLDICIGSAGSRPGIDARGILLQRKIPITHCDKQRIDVDISFAFVASHHIGIRNAWMTEFSS